MSTSTPPFSECFEVLRGNVLIPQSSPYLNDNKDKPIVVVGVFGSSHLTGKSGFKRAFRLAIDSFGMVNLFQQQPEDDNLKGNLNSSSTIIRSDDNLRCGGTQQLQKQTDDEAIGSSGGGDDYGSRGPWNGKNCRINGSQTDVSKGMVGGESEINVSFSDSDCGVKAEVNTEGVRLPAGGVRRGSSSSNTGERKSLGGFEDNRETGSDSHMNVKLSLDGFYNVNEGVLFLHLEGAYDPKLFANAKDDLLRSLRRWGFVPEWVNIKSSYCKYLLLMFSLSHVMILSDVGSSFDTSYLHLFRILDAIRQKLKPVVVQKLEKIGNLPKDWVTHGRLCSPRLLCLYEVEQDELTKVKTPQSVLKPPMKKKKNILEDEIYNILRKCRIITNIRF